MLDGSNSVTPLRLVLAVATLATVLVCGLAAAPLAAAQPTAGAPQVVAGPAGDVSLGGLAIARDGTGGLVFLENAGGAEHVFASRLIGGVFQPPTQLDAGLAGSSTQAVIAGTNGGILIVAFVNSGNLFVSGTSSTSSAWSAPLALAPGAADPALSMNTFGEAYLAYTATVGGGSDVDVQYYNAGTWAPASPLTMNVTPGDDAGTGLGGPQIATAGDGVAIVAWGEQGHVWSRRVWGTSTSVETEQLDPSRLDGWSEVSADTPSISVGGDSSYVDIAFRENLQSAGQTQSRVMLARLRAETTVPAVALDGLSTPGSESAAEPAVAMTEYGRGFMTAATTSSDRIYATPLAANGVPGSTEEIATGLDGVLPYALPAAAGLTSNLITWQATTAPGVSQIVIRYAQDGVDLGPETLLSSPSGGSTDAVDGLAAGGDGNGDAAVAWVQGPLALQTVDVAQLYQPPSEPTPSASFDYASQARPTLTWSPSHAYWGPLVYTVTLDGATVAQTSGTSFAVPNTLIDGPHSWQVQVTDPAGQSSTSSRVTVFVDTEPPRLRIMLSGRPRVRQPVTLTLFYVDPPNPAEPGSIASGLASVIVRWGRAAPAAAPLSTRGVTAIKHVFTRPGLYRLSVLASDRAGNEATIVRYVHVLPAVAAAPASTAASTTRADRGAPK